MIVVLTGGTGGAKFIDGLQRAVPQEDLTLIVNTGDDLVWWGLHVSPDIDSVTYVLAEMLDRERGWGVRGDTFQCKRSMEALGEAAWFSVGDRDLATHLLRTQLLSAGTTLSAATAVIAQKFGVRSRILPMTDHRVETHVVTDAGDLAFEEYFVKRRCQDTVKSVYFDGVESARPAAGVLDAIESAEVIVLAPSNPITSIGPILAVPGIRHALRAADAPIAAVSPIVGGAAVSGPAAALMKAAGFEPSVSGVAHAYSDFLDLLIADDRDAAEASRLRNRELDVFCADTIMKSAEQTASLARLVLQRALESRMARAGRH
jgi:LPPG:FO 2-phospho-L-lactate transferase